MNTMQESWAVTGFAVSYKLSSPFLFIDSEHYWNST